MFEEKPANRSSISKRKLLSKFGINDADYITQPTINGKLRCCPYYKVWSSMIRRCYSLRMQSINPTYSFCSVTEEWRYFMSFRAWMITQDWKGNQLDKDIIKPGNKIYSPKFCSFVSSQVNSLLTHCKSSVGDYPTGVSFHKQSNKFRADISICGKLKTIGRFDTPEEAAHAYIKEKVTHIFKIAHKQTDSRIKKGLILHAELIFQQL